MATDGSPIDVSVLEALIELRKQQAQVDQFCQRADERKDKVESAVYTRVMADYGKPGVDLEAALKAIAEEEPPTQRAPSGSVPAASGAKAAVSESKAAASESKAA